MTESTDQVSRSEFRASSTSFSEASNWASLVPQRPKSDDALFRPDPDKQKPFGQKLSAAVSLSLEERQVLNSIPAHNRTYPGETELFLRGQPLTHALVLQKGWACAHRTLPSGARQILSIYVPGDLIGFRGTGLPSSDPMVADESVMALTATEASEVGIKRLSEAFAVAPRLAVVMLWDPSRTRAILEERLVSLGRRNARERTAHFFLELAARLAPGEPEPATSFACPLSQYVIADALGLSAEHLNRVMRQLRLAGLLCVRRGRADLLNVDALVKIADFDPAYLRTSAHCAN